MEVNSIPTPLAGSDLRTSARLCGPSLTAKESSISFPTGMESRVSRKQPFRLMSVSTPVMDVPEPATIRAGIWQGTRLKPRLSTVLEVDRDICLWAWLILRRLCLWGIAHYGGEPGRSRISWLWAIGWLGAIKPFRTIHAAERTALEKWQENAFYKNVAMGSANSFAPAKGARKLRGLAQLFHRNLAT